MHELGPQQASHRPELCLQPCQIQRVKSQASLYTRDFKRFLIAPAEVKRKNLAGLPGGLADKLMNSHVGRPSPRVISVSLALGSAP
jgi:hypothetical protein